jgi:3-hydroxyacyl-CoA dehydrogenase
VKLNAMTDLMVEGDVAVLTIENPPDNAFTPEVRDGIYEGLGRAIEDSVVKVVALICAGRTFVAGNEICAPDARQEGAPTRQIARRMEESPKPVVAAIHGAALGIGFELTLAAHWRIATRSARVGLPGVKLGIVPGAGGTQRLPRLVGAGKALDMIVLGEAISAEEAHKAGAIDAVVDHDNLRVAAIAFARQAAKEPRALKRARDSFEIGSAEDEMSDEFQSCMDRHFEAFKDRHKDIFRGAVAPAACMRIVRAAFELPFEAGLDLEREIADALIPSGGEAIAGAGIYLKSNQQLGARRRE